MASNYMLSREIRVCRTEKVTLYSRPYLVMSQHVEPLPVTLDLRGHVLVLQDDPNPSALTPLCGNRKQK